MTDTKIQGKFYRLQHQEWLRSCRELTPAKVDVFYYFNTISPCSERVSIPYSIIASVLKKDKSTVSRAIQALKAKNWLPDWFEVRFREHELVEGGDA